MVRVGIDEKVAAELVKDFPQGSEIVRIPRDSDERVEVDFWILPTYGTNQEAAGEPG